MSTVVACYKWVVDEADIRIGDDLSVDVSKARKKISEFDRSAIEAAMQASEEMSAQAVTLTYGSDDVEASLKDALSRGPQKGYWIATEASKSADAIVTSKVLSAAIRGIEDVSLAICAEGASDTYARQIGPRLGAILDWPTITSVVDFTIKDGAITATRKLEEVTQTVTADLPAVVSVLPEGFDPKAPGLKAIMAAKKKPDEQIFVSDLQIDETPISNSTELKGFVMSRKNIIIENDDEAIAAQELAQAMRKEGVL